MIEFFVTEGLLGSRSEPKLPIECLRVQGLHRPVALIVLPPIGPDLCNPAETAPVNQLDRIAKVHPAALLHAALQDALAGSNCARECRAFLNGVGDRLFQVDIFPRCQRIDCHAHVPMVRRPDDYCIDVLFQNFTVVQVGRGYPVRSLPNNIAVGCIDVTYGHDLVRTDLVRSIEQALHPAAGSDHSNASRIVRSPNSSCSECGKSTCDEETAASRHTWQGSLPWWELILSRFRASAIPNDSLVPQVRVRSLDANLGWPTGESNCAKHRG